MAGLAGGVAPYITRKKRNKDNRAHWFGGACLAMALLIKIRRSGTLFPLFFPRVPSLRAREKNSLQAHSTP